MHGEFVEALRRAGFRGSATKDRDTAALPEGVEKWLFDVTIPAQLAALRSLHNEIRQHGASPELLGALARGYAMLGGLAERLVEPRAQGLQGPGVTVRRAVGPEMAGPRARALPMSPSQRHPN